MSPAMAHAVVPCDAFAQAVRRVRRLVAPMILIAALLSALAAPSHAATKKPGSWVLIAEALGLPADACRGRNAGY